MTKQEFIRKITSRKLWIAIIGDVIGICSLLTASSDAQIQTVASIILVICSSLSYIIGESKVDAINVANNVISSADQIVDIIEKYEKIKAEAKEDTKAIDYEESK